MTPEQEISASEMRESLASVMAITDGLMYIEKELGKTHKIAINFKENMVKKYHDKFIEKQKSFEECGGADALAEISEKTTIDLLLDLLFEEYSKAMKATKNGQVFPHWFDHEQLKWIKTVLNKR